MKIHTLPLKVWSCASHGRHPGICGEYGGTVIIHAWPEVNRETNGAWLEWGEELMLCEYQLVRMPITAGHAQMPRFV